MVWKIPLFKMYNDEDDVRAVTKVIRRGTSWAIGPEIVQFEKAVAEYSGIEHAVAFNSGTSALHALLLAHDVRGKEVIVPSFTFISTANAIVLAGGIPVFSESERDTLGLDVEDVRKRITRNTRAIIQVHYAGYPGKDTEALAQIAKENNMIFIEDAAESFGASIKGKITGTFGDSAIFSFCQNKVLATGEGGMIITHHKQIAERTRLIRSHGRVEHKGDYFKTIQDNDYIDIGYNYRMPTMVAALGISQLRKIDVLIQLRRERAKWYENRFTKNRNITTLKTFPGYCPTHQMYSILLPSQEMRENIKRKLNEANIMSKVYFNPVHLQSIYREKYGYTEGILPRTEDIAKRVLTLPFFPTLQRDEMDAVSAIVLKYSGAGR